MVFDKTKAMRNAERYLAQGKIQSAIGEYKMVVSHDPKDFGSLNMLGDLYTKNSQQKDAVTCYTSVAEHYSKQGFAQKAIAIYNKISKIQPNSIEISAKLADLYKFKGSVNEARAHYQIVANHYEKEGRKLDALEVRKQIASLDPGDTTVHLVLAAAYLEEDQPDEAANAYAEAGQRLARKSKHAEAVEAFEKALAINPSDSKILVPYVESHFALGTPGVAAQRLSEIHSAAPHDHDVLRLLIDCHLETGNNADAEKGVISLVEKEPASYPKFLDLARLYVKNNDAESAARVTAIASEHLLLAGQVEEFQTLLREILELDPEQLEGLRLSARLAAWQRDETAMYDSLSKLAIVARQNDIVDDERFALSQLVMIAPHEVEHAERLREIDELHGFEDAHVAENLFDQQFLKAPRPAAEPELETFASAPVQEAQNDVEVVEPESASDFMIVDTSSIEDEDAVEDVTAEETEQDRLLREVESIKFYIDSEYYELAEKAISEIRGEFGDRSEIDDLRAHLERAQAGASGAEDAATAPEPVAQTNGQPASSPGFGIDDLRSELGLDEADASADDSDYDTHYHTAVAYQEMGLLDEAVKEFQEAVGLVQPDDPTRRFFQCANLLGHCFMQKGMPNLALTWYQRALETPGLSDEEKQGIWYELASAYEADGDMDSAGRYFEQVYAENIDFRDVSERVRNIAVSQ